MSPRVSLPLSDFLLQHRDAIMASWEVEVRRFPVAQVLERPALRDGLPRLLEVVAGMMARRQQTGVSSGLGALPDLHALERLGEGFDLRQVVAEYRLLRAAVLRLWAESENVTPHPDEERVFHEALDEAVAASVSRYTRARERTLQALDRISAAALGSTDVAGFLPRLLQVLRETVVTVDVAAVLLREASSLRVESVVGEASLPVGALLPLGEGFCGAIAATGQPLLVHDASGDARVRADGLHAAGLRALYGVPLELHGQILGVALMGSRGTSEVSDEDLLLFRAMAARATALLAQAQAHAREREARAEAEASLARLRQSEARLRRWEDIFTHLGVGMSVVSADDNVLRMVNPAFARMHGYTPEELVGRPQEDTLAPEARGALPRHVAAAHSKANHEYEALHVRKDGSRFPAFTHVTSIRDESGKLVQRAGTVLDITQRRTAELERQRLLATIEAERARLAAVLDQLPAGVFIAEAPSGQLVLGNPRVEEILGFAFRPSADISEYAQDYVSFHPDGRRYASEEWPLARSLLTGEVVQGEEIQMQRGDGTRAMVLQSSAPIRDREGVIVAGVVTFVDVTERRRAEELAQQAARFGERLIAIVSHDLRNPLNAIHLSATKLLHSESLPERERRAVARIAKSGERMTRMISELLDFTRGRLGGGIPIHRVPGDLRGVARQGVEELEAAWPERSLTLKVAPGRYDGQWDADRLLQVVSNLGGNALQYSPPDSPVTFLLADAGDAVVFEVHNGGAPIPAAALPHLFDPFRRVATGGHGGLGLGLYIVEQVVKGHGGRMEVTSTEAEGTTFRATLPRG